MNRSSLNQLDVTRAAELLALRKAASAEVGGFVKEADLQSILAQLKAYASQAANQASKHVGDAAGWVGEKAKQVVPKNIRDTASNIWNATPNYAGAAETGELSSYWDAVRNEAIRNALLGGGVGGSLGALKGLISGQSIGGEALTGGLLGAGLGGGGTMVGRGFEALTGEAPSAAKQRVADDEEAKRLAKILRESEQPQGAVPDDIYKQRQAEAALEALGAGQLGNATKAVGRLTGVSGVLDDAANNPWDNVTGGVVGGAMGEALKRHYFATQMHANATSPEYLKQKGFDVTTKPQNLDPRALEALVGKAPNKPSMTMAQAADPDYGKAHKQRMGKYEKLMKAYNTKIKALPEGHQATIGAATAGKDRFYSRNLARELSSGYWSKGHAPIAFRQARNNVLGWRRGLYPAIGAVLGATVGPQLGGPINDLGQGALHYGQQSAQSLYDAVQRGKTR